MRFVLLGLGLLVIAPLRLGAQPTDQFRVQARLRDSGGNPIVTPQDVTLRLFTTAESGAPLAVETDSVVPDSAGVFETVFGDQVTFDPATFGQDLFLEVEVPGGGGPLGPRVALVPSPAAIYAHRAERAVALQPAADLDVSDVRITSLGEPVDPGDAATKAYVDSEVAAVPAGPPGPAGPTGPTGSDGPAGPTGPTGPAGAGMTRVITVDGGSSASTNGANLVAAVNGITGNSAAAPFLVRVGPGVFTIGSTLTLGDHVALEGAGRFITQIEGSAGSGVPSIALAGTAAQARGFSLDVSTLGGTALGISISGDHARVTDVFLTATGGFGQSATAIEVNGVSQRAFIDEVVASASALGGSAFTLVASLSALVGVRNSELGGDVEVGASTQVNIDGSSVLGTVYVVDSSGIAYLTSGRVQGVFNPGGGTLACYGVSSPTSGGDVDPRVCP